MHHPVIMASVWMIGTLFSFVGMAVAGRELSADFGTFQILALRSLVGLVIIAALLTRTGWGQVSLRDFRTHLLRNLAHFGGQFGWFYAIAFIPLAAVFAIEFTVPLWTAIFAAILLGERISGTRILAVALGIAGVLTILRPGLEVIHPAALAILAGAVGYAMSHTLTKKLGAHDSTLCILFFMMLIQLPLGFVPAAFDWVSPGLAHLPWIVVVGFTGLTAHYCMVRAFKLADASVVVPMDFLRLPLVGLVGFALYGERVDLFLALGAALIVAGNFLNVSTERKKATGVPAAATAEEEAAR
ncbi:MAG: DMT family transporter [Halofilum sp. (in: g-proteobacteria)]